MATVASFFSGVGGLDLGLEAAGWQVLSFSEIEPFACRILAERWPGVPNLGDILALSAAERGNGERHERDGGLGPAVDCEHGRHRIPDADLWTGGFPCQDLSVAGKRAGLAGARSGLAFAFLDLVERHRPPAILLENVPGLLSSHGGRDMAALLGRMVELGYGVAYRVLDAQFVGVPQRRRRVFILGLRSGEDDPDGRVAAERAAAVLSVGARCARHPAAGQQTGQESADGIGDGVAATLGSSLSGGQRTTDLNTPLAHAVRSRTGRNGSPERGDETIIAASVSASAGHHGHSSPRGDGSDNLIATLRVGGRDKAHRAGDSYDNTPWLLAPPDPDGVRAPDGLAGRVDDPAGLDSARYRVIGNGVVAPVAEWIGRRLR